MLPSAWDLATLLSKLLVYTGTAMLAGGWMHSVFFDDGSSEAVRAQLKFVLTGALLGFHATLIHFFIQIGVINANGLAGMLDWGMARIMLDTPLGDMTMLRLSGFAIGLIVPAFLLWQLALGRGLGRGLYLAARPGLALALIAVVFSFRLSGHISLLGPAQQFALLVHVLVFALWIGAIPLFVQRGRAWNAVTLKISLRQFGNQALVLVIVLTASAGIMLLSLMHSPAELWTTTYGLAILVKVLFVALTLALAALNRYRLVPALLMKSGRANLQRSLRAEIAVAMLVLAVTAFLSTLVGPSEF